MKNTLLVSFLVLGAAACSSYRVVKVQPQSGEVALEGSREAAREKANGYMASRCPSGFDIVEEGEAVVGQDIATTSRPTTTLFGGTATNTSGSTTDKREWRLKYQCKGTAPNAAAADPAAPQTTPPTVAPAPAGTTPAPAPAPLPSQPAPGGAKNEIHTLIVRF